MSSVKTTIRGAKRPSKPVAEKKTKRLKTDLEESFKIDDSSESESGKKIKKTSTKSGVRTKRQKSTDKLKKDVSKKLKSEIPKKSKLKKTGISKEYNCKWRDEDYLAQAENLSVTTAKNIIELFKQENTIPFIARYRTHLTGDIAPDKLRKIKSTYDYIQVVHEKANKVLQQAAVAKEITPELLSYIETAQTVEEIEFVGSQFKKNTGSLAERARKLGLEPAALSFLQGQDIKFESLVQPTVPELGEVSKVKLGIQHIIADIISKNADVHSHLEEIYRSNKVLVKSTLKKHKSDGEEKAKTLSKYHLYCDFSQPLNTIKPHQTLAINRGESENELSVKIVIPDFLWLSLKSYCEKKWLMSGRNYDLRKSLFSDSVDDAIKRLLSPLVTRRIRAKLNAEAENEALGIFASNLRQLLMTPPCSGHFVMGIDPGFKNGCKLAVVSQTGQLLEYDKFFLSDKPGAKKILKSLICDYNVELIALGNGTACRETETLLSDFIKKGVFQPVSVTYTIISEQAVSIYSCSPLAKEEFPDLHPTVVGAISIARRLQNPLSELVKIEPKHLGVGMYQHDVKESKLSSTLNDVVSECVSFVGVDVNTASETLLKHVAGLSSSKAQEIIKYRTEVCSFTTREDLKKVKGIKTKTFLQCAGFLRVVPSTARCPNHEICPGANRFNPLDETSIHPESYDAAYKVMDLFQVRLDQLGTQGFIDTIKEKKSLKTIEELAKYCDCSTVAMTFIIDTLMLPKDFDLRSLSFGPVFQKEVLTLEDLSINQSVEGIVRNIVSFGAFVDIGVGINGLIHTSKMGGTVLKLNDRVKVQVLDINKSNRRIQLKLISLIK